METSIWNNILRFGVYLIAAIFLIFLYIEAEFLTKHQRVEDINLDCQPLIDGTSHARKLASFPLHWIPITDELLQEGEICPTLHKYFYFQKENVSLEEKEFPIAFGFAVHVDPIQVLLTLSLLYRPQNQYCITIDNRSAVWFKKILMRIPRCFDNVRIQIGDPAYPPTHKNGVMNNVYQCVNELISSGSKWEYYQPELAPAPLYQGGMGVILPRKAAEYLVEERKTAYLLNYLNKTHLPYESFWATIAGNKKSFPVPGALDGKTFVKAQQVTSVEEMDMDAQTVDNIDTTFIARFEVSTYRPYCSQNPMCFFEVTDLPLLLRRPEMFAHKIFMTIHPAAYICLAKELRQRSLNPVALNTSSYSKMPTVELHNGVALEDLSYPEWMAVPIKYEKF